MVINTNYILSFTTALAILPSALGRALSPFGQPLIQKRADVSYVWSIANGDIAPVKPTSNFNTILALRIIIGWLHSLCRSRKWVGFVIVFIISLTDLMHQSIPWSYHYGQ